MLVFIKSWFGVPNIRYHAWRYAMPKTVSIFPARRLEDELFYIPS